MITRTKIIVISFLLCFLVCTKLTAQNFETQILQGNEVGMDAALPRVTADFEHFISSPTRINEKSLGALTGISVVTAGLMLGVDMPVYREFHNNVSPSFKKLAGLGRFYDSVGPPVFVLGSSGLLLGSGYLFKDVKMAKTGWTAIEAVIFTQLATGFLKSTVGRKRPFLRKGNFSFEPFDLDEGNPYRSFPSGHTSKIFALSTVIASSYDSPWVRIPAYAFAGSVALQRVACSDHWFSDVAIGGLLGYTIGRTLAKRNGLVKSTSNIQPVVQGGMVGLNIRF